MSFTEDHILQCTCSECLNRGGGTPLRNAPVTITPACMPPSWRRRGERSRAAVELARRQAEEAQRLAEIAVARAAQSVERANRMAALWERR